MGFQCDKLNNIFVFHFLCRLHSVHYSLSPENCIIKISEKSSEKTFLFKRAVKKCVSRLRFGMRLCVLFVVISFGIAIRCEMTIDRPIVNRFCGNEFICHRVFYFPFIFGRSFDREMNMHLILDCLLQWVFSWAIRINHIMWRCAPRDCERQQSIDNFNIDTNSNFGSFVLNVLLQFHECMLSFFLLFLFLLVSLSIVSNKCLANKAKCICNISHNVYSIHKHMQGATRALTMHNFQQGYLFYLIAFDTLALLSIITHTLARSLSFHLATMHCDYKSNWANRNYTLRVMMMFFIASPRFIRYSPEFFDYSSIPSSIIPHCSSASNYIDAIDWCFFQRFFFLLNIEIVINMEKAEQERERERKDES